MRKKYKYINLLLGATLIITPLSTLIEQNINKAEANTGRIAKLHKISDRNHDDLLTEQNTEFFKLLDRMPLNIAQGTIDGGVKWLNNNKTSKLGFGEFVAVNGNITFKSYQRSAGSCAWEITKAVASNFLPWGRILKIKKLAAGVGGIASLARLIYTSAKHQKRLGYSNITALKRATRIVLKNFPHRDAQAIFQLFAIDGVVRSCV